MFRLIKKLFGIKTKVSTESLAEVYWAMCKKYSSTLHDDLSESLDRQEDVSIDVGVLIEEIVFNLWIISSALAPDKKVLDSLHHDIFIKKICDSYDSISNKELQNLLHERYAEYHKAWNGLEQPAISVAAIFLKNRDEQQQNQHPNAMVIFKISVHVMAVMESVLRLRKDYVLQE